MEDVFFHHVLPFINDHIFHKTNICLLKKHKYLKERQQYINRTHSANGLNVRFWVWETDVDKLYEEHNHLFLNDPFSFIRYTMEVLLEERDMNMLSETMFEERFKIVVPKHMISNTVIHFDTNQKIRVAEFETGQLGFRENIKICSVYRLTSYQKKQLFDNCPHAKALIY